MWRAICLVLLPGLASAESLVAARVIPAQGRIAAGDVMLVDAEIPGAVTSAAAAIGLETRVAIFPGRPVLAADLGPPALVERNGIVTLIYRAGTLTIRAEGRALQRAGQGESVRVMNLASKATVTGQVAPDGTVIVGGKS